MRRFRDVPIRRKLVVTGWAISVSALVLSTAVFMYSAYMIARRTAITGSDILASIVADNLTAAASFQNAEDANEILRSLRATPTIDFACAYDKDHRLLAQFSSTGQACPPSAPPDQRWQDRGKTMVVRAIATEGRREGTLFLQGNLVRFSEQIQLQGLGAAAAGIVGLLTAMVIAAWLHRQIEDPLLSLSATAAKISKHGDYAIRASKTGNDEIGTLVDSFNDMVSGIERRDDELRAANRTKDEFLAALSHELRTPMNAIVGWLQILRMQAGNPEMVEQALVRLDRNAQAQVRLIEDLLDISRIVSGKLELKLAPADLAQVIQAAVDSIRPSAKMKEIALQVSLPGTKCLVSGDADRLQQVFANLLSNAVKFTSQGGRIDVTLEESDSSYSVSVRDNGIGIDPAFLPRVFDRFRQADGSITRQHGGLGLGLAIARDLTALHNGRLEAASAGEGQGSTFTVVLPRILEESSRAASARPESDLLLKGVHVLVVDDDADAQVIAREALSASGARVFVSSSGPEALAQLDRSEFDVIMCDVQMPEMDGYALLRKIREREWTKGRFTPAVAVTAHASAAEQEHAESAGYQQFVTKPYNFETLARAVADAGKRNV